MKYIAEDLKSKKIKKLALMLQNLDVNIYIFGENGVGKTHLANFIGNSLIIENFDQLKSFPKIEQRLIAIGKRPLSQNLIEKFDITVQIELENLKTRENDTKAFIDMFVDEVKNSLKIDYDFNVKIDITENLNSLKKSIYRSALCKIDSRKEMIEVLENYFDENYDELKNNYNKELQIFDTAIIKSLQKRYKSKLQMAKVLKINRATLSKKVKEIENRNK